MRATDTLRPLDRLQGMALALVLSACTAGQTGRETPSRPTVQAGEFGTADCFLRRTVQDFEVLDDRNLIVFAPGKSEAYHIQVSMPATELRFASVLAFESRSSRICGYAGDSLLIGDAGPGLRRLPVAGVYRLDEVALEGLQARFGRGAGRAGSQAPQPGGGATIERDLGAEQPQ